MFEKEALDIFKYQWEHNPVYHEFCRLLGKSTGNVTTIEEIPFLPVDFFKSHRVVTGNFEAELVFNSSGTTGKQTSKHYIKNKAFYLENAAHCFGYFFKEHTLYKHLALLPNYIETGGSSLVAMVDYFISTSELGGGFYINEWQKLEQELVKCSQANTPVVLWGVSFALLDFSEQIRKKFPNLIIVETGGMKGRRKEITRKELHSKLCYAFGVSKIHSEYGMTELQSQAYAIENGIFECPPGMRILLSDQYDRLSKPAEGRPGLINIIDFANIDSCSFIATQDIGLLHPDNKFEVLGRADFSETRGCNLLYV